jgi:hypothetical protein
MLRGTTEQRGHRQQVTDGSCGTDTFGDHYNEPAVVETLQRSASQQDVRRLLQVARDSVIGRAVTRAQSPTHALIEHFFEFIPWPRGVLDLVYLEFGFDLGHACCSDDGCDCN